MSGLKFVCCCVFVSNLRGISVFLWNIFVKSVRMFHDPPGLVSHVKWILNVLSSLTLHLILIPKMSRHSSAVTGQMLDLFRIFKLNNGLAWEREKKNFSSQILFSTGKISLWPPLMRDLPPTTTAWWGWGSTTWRGRTSGSTPAGPRTASARQAGRLRFTVRDWGKDFY